MECVEVLKRLLAQRLPVKRHASDLVLGKEWFVSESDWLTSTDPQAMLSFLRDRGPVSERKLRLFSLFCCRRVWHLLPEGSRDAVEVAERSVDVDVDNEERSASRRGASDAVTSAVQARDQDPDMPEMYILAARAVSAAGRTPDLFGPDAAKAVVAACSLCSRHLDSGLDRATEHAAYCDMLRELFGNAVRRVSFSPEWRTEAVVALARGIYEERAWERMGVLADALEEAGCDSKEVLEHCRGPNVHHRGCWLIDKVLQKT